MQEFRNLPLPTVAKIKNRVGWSSVLLWWQVLGFPSKFLRFGDNLKSLSFLEKNTLQSLKQSFGIQPHKPSPQLCSNSLSHHSFDFPLVRPQWWAHGWRPGALPGGTALKMDFSASFMCWDLDFFFFLFCHHESGQKYPERTATFFGNERACSDPGFFLLRS